METRGILVGGTNDVFKIGNGFRFPRLAERYLAFCGYRGRFRFGSTRGKMAILPAKMYRVISLSGARVLVTLQCLKRSQ